MLTDSLRRGLAAGVAAGLLAGIFALLVGDDVVREAIRLEEKAATDAAATTTGEEAAEGQSELSVSRTVQQALLPVGTAVVGTAFGGLFGLAFAFARRGIADPSHWRASWKLGSAAWVAVALLPSLTSPPNPPAVGDPGTLGSRSGWYLATILLGLLAAVALWWLGQRLRTSNRLPPHVRQVVVGLAALAAVALLLLVVPTSDHPIEIPPRLLWDFRLASIGTQLVLWAGIAGINGWLWERTQETTAGADSRVMT
jgi:predicted cobalt transporter CbtA